MGMILIESFDVPGSDGRTYKVDLWEHPGPEHKPLNGPRRRMRGRREWLLDDGTDLIDVSDREWEILDRGVRLTKPEGR